MATKEPKYRPLSAYKTREEQVEAVRQAMKDGHSNVTAAKALKTSPGTIAGIRYKHNIPSMHGSPPKGADRAPPKTIAGGSTGKSVKERSMSKDPKKMSGKDRKRLIIGLFEANTPIDEICRKLGGKREDLREFIRLNSPENLATLDALVRSEGEPEEKANIDAEHGDEAEALPQVEAKPRTTETARSFFDFRRKRNPSSVDEGNEERSSPKPPVAPPRPAYVDLSQTEQAIPRSWWPDPVEAWGEEKRPVRAFAVTEAVQCVWGKDLGRDGWCACVRNSQNPDLCAYHRRAYDKFVKLRKPARSA